MRISTKRAYEAYRRYSAIFSIVRILVVIAGAMGLWFTSPNFANFAHKMGNGQPRVALGKPANRRQSRKQRPFTVKAAITQTVARTAITGKEAETRVTTEPKRAATTRKTTPQHVRPSMRSRTKELDREFVLRRLREAGIDKDIPRLPPAPKGMAWL